MPSQAFFSRPRRASPPSPGPQAATHAADGHRSQKIDDGGRSQPETVSDAHHPGGEAAIWPSHRSYWPSCDNSRKRLWPPPNPLPNPESLAAASRQQPRQLLGRGDLHHCPLWARPSRNRSSRPHPLPPGREWRLPPPGSWLPLAVLMTSVEAAPAAVPVAVTDVASPAADGSRSRKIAAAALPLCYNSPWQQPAAATLLYSPPTDGDSPLLHPVPSVGHHLEPLVIRRPLHAAGHHLEQTNTRHNRAPRRHVRPRSVTGATENSPCGNGHRQPPCS